MHRGKSEGADNSVAAPDNEEELPWQVICIGSASVCVFVYMCESVHVYMCVYT